MEGGASTMSCAWSNGKSGGGSNWAATEVRAVGAHGAMPLQFAGAHGRWQGAWSCVGACGVVGIGAVSLPIPMSIDIDAIDELPPTLGMAHATPLPSTMNWRSVRTAARAAKRRGRLMILKLQAPQGS
jgi:hypothetical protein